MNLKQRICALGLLGMWILPALAQLPESALDHMLQRPVKVKRFENKTFGDHFFVEGGIGTRFQVKRTPSPRLSGNIAFGDWLTPEHGWRISASLGQMHAKHQNMSMAAASVDYLLNLNALCAWNEYKTRKRFEVFGVAGVDLLATKLDGDKEMGFGAHLGLRGQLNISSLTYFYVEPQLGVARDNVMQDRTFHKYRFTSNVQAGLGYSFNKYAKRVSGGDYNSDFLDNTFVSFFGGPTAFIFSDAHTFNQGIGLRGGVGLGKNFTPVHAARLSVHGGANRQYGALRLTTAGLQADYILNIHSLLGGYKPNRPFWLNAVAGMGMYVSSNEEQVHRAAFGLGAGLQANVRVSDRISFYLEPRIDGYRSPYSPEYAATDHWDAVGSLMAGVTYHYRSDSPEKGEVTDFSLAPWQSHLFFDLAGGATAYGHSNLLRYPKKNLKATTNIGAGIWLSPSSGARVWGSFGQVRPFGDVGTVKFMAVGADYLWNITNTIRGYNPDRTREFIAGIGLTAERPSGVDADFHLGAKASIRRQWNINRSLGLYIEQEIRVYKDDCFPGYASKSGLDVHPSLLAGVQFKMNAQDTDTYQEAWDESDTKGYFSFAAGPSVQGIGVNNHWRPGLLTRLSYVHMLSPLNSWRYNLTLYGSSRGAHTPYVAGTAGVDFMTDFTARAFGYDPDRVVSLKGFVGADVGMSYQAGMKKNFAADLEAGTQISFRVGRAVNLYVEPQLAWSLNNLFDMRMQRPRPAVLFGLDYMIKRRAKADYEEELDKKNFVSVGGGMGVYSGTLNLYSKMKKLTFTSDITYGRWLTSMHGVRIGGSLTRMHRSRRNGYKLNSYHADYMINLRRAITGVDGEKVHLTGFLGLNLTTLAQKNHDTRLAPGLQGSIQVGWSVLPALEFFAEPSASMYAKRLVQGTTHPFEGEVRLMVGTKVNF